MDDLFNIHANGPLDVTYGYTADPFSHMSDDDLLATPSYCLSDAIRMAACGGRTYVGGDNVDTTYAAVRIPYESSTQLDLFPHLDFSDYNPIDDGDMGPYACNMTLASASIPPRIAEPTVAPRTRISGFSATKEDIPLGALEKALISATRAIQLVKKCNGDYVELARVLGSAWGDAGLFDAEEEVDLLGDVSLPRVLASSGKRRYDIYRNVGWTNIVNAGYSEASNSSFGPASIIDWQRRVELAKLYVHMAIALEGKVLDPTSVFEIAVRIPTWTVKHLDWDDLSFQVDPTEFKVTTANPAMLARAQNFLKTTLRSALDSITMNLRAGGIDVEWRELHGSIAKSYEKLTFHSALPSNLAARDEKRVAEIASSRLHERRFELQTATKSHDLRTALIDAVGHLDPCPNEVPHSVAFWAKLAILSSELSPAERLDAIFSSKAYEATSAFRLVAGNLVKRPAHLSERHARAEWERIYRDQIPARINGAFDAYTVNGLTYGAMYTAISDSTSQAFRALRHINGELSARLAVGLRSKVLNVGSQKLNVVHAMYSDVLLTTKTHFRTRNRKYGDAYSVAAYTSRDERKKKKWQIAAAGRYALADYIHHTELSVSENVPTMFVPVAARTQVWSVYGHHIGKIDKQKLGKVSNMADSDVVDLLRTRVRGFVETPYDTTEGTPDWVLGRISKYGQELQSDLTALHAALIAPDDPDEVMDDDVAEVVEAPATLGELIASATAERARTSVDDVVSYWAKQAGGGYGAEEVEGLVEWIEEHGAEHKINMSSYLATHSVNVDRTLANRLLEEWFERMDAEEGDMYDLPEIN